MSTSKTITIDASSATGGIDLDTYFATYFGGLKTGASSYHGGVADPAPYGYQNGTQVGFRYADSVGDPTNKQVLIEGENLAYDFAHYGPTAGHGNSGTIQSVTFGTADTAQAAGPAGLTGGTAELGIPGWKNHYEPGLGNKSADPGYEM